MSKKITISDEVRELINEVAHTTSVSLAGASEQINYYRATENLLYNYKRIAALLADYDAYTQVELQQRSKDIVTLSHGGKLLAPGEAEEIATCERQRSYERTLAHFREIDRVVSLFRHQREFVVIRLYYFGEDVDGNQREDTAQYTWDDVAFDLEEADILHDVKTARRWRNKIISDMAVCFFGSVGAVSVASHSSNRRKKNDC